MDPMKEDKDWKKKVGFPINYNSGQSSEDDFDNEDVVMRHPKRTAYLLDDQGDGSEADLLGTTPPRSRIRDKEKRRTIIDSVSANRTMRDNRRNTTDNFWLPEKTPVVERLKRRATVKLIRGKERDWKQDGGETRADSLPSANPIAGVPTLVESCSRFMSLSSKLKCRESSSEEGSAGEEGGAARAEAGEAGDVVLRDPLPPSRLSFHQTFSMLINMGNMDKGCRRTISREEQVWQNELKDLIWLELRARIAGRTLPQQDAELCRQRAAVPAHVLAILHYRFVNKNPCRGGKRSRSKSTDKISNECKHENKGSGSDSDDESSEDMDGCLLIYCPACVDAIGAAMREIGTLLDAFFNAVSLYPSSKAMQHEHPLIATPLFKNRLKALCLWYNITLHMRLKLLAVRRMLRAVQHKAGRRDPATRISTESLNHNRKVQFNVNSTSGSSNSEYSSQSEGNKDDIATNKSLEEEIIEREKEKDEKQPEYERRKSRDDVDSGVEKSYDEAPPTPEIVISDLAPASACDERPACELAASLRDVTRLRLLHACSVSPYRNYHYEVLKTAGVRRCMMVINNMRKAILDKVLVTYQKIDTVEESPVEAEEEREGLFNEARDEDEKVDETTNEEDEYELRRFGVWSAESLAMRLPPYRGHFLLLSSICMEAVHDYLTMRLEAQPDQPSCLTVKQLIHELKEGLDIASEMRLAFVRDVRAAGAGGGAGEGGVKGRDLSTIVHTFDKTVGEVVELYHRYLCLMSGTERLGRGCLEAEWQFACRVARRLAPAAATAPEAFTTVACNQLHHLLTRFKEKFEHMTSEHVEPMPEIKQTVYAMCRSAQALYAGERDGLLHTAQWARALAARLARARRPRYTAMRMKIFEHIIAIRDFIVSQTVMIIEKSAFPDEQRTEMPDGVAGRIRELVLQVFRVGFELHKEMYKFVQVTFPSELVVRKRPASLQPARPMPIDHRRRPETMILNESFNKTMMHRELHRLTQQARPAPRRPLHPAAPPRQHSITEEAYDDQLFDNADGQHHNSTESLLAEERLAEGEGGAGGGEEECARRVARAIVEFARCWMTFVMERCDRGRGLRPRWANQGLEFLMLACDPHNTKHLTDEEFEELKQLMDGCISHVVGSRRPPRPDPAPAPRHRLHSPMSSREASVGKETPTPPTTPPSWPDPHLDYPPEQNKSHSVRVLEATRRLDQMRDEKLREKKTVGRVHEAEVESYSPKLRQLTFKWQRGLKIGAGTFGKVYTVVNTESGQLLAMKELSVAAGDRRALQRAANELRVLEGVAHPHLVRYYGTEQHRESLLLFMELCVEGSLEALLAASGALDEAAARRYSRQLLAALAELHARHIVHRDVKSGNIFLTNGGHCLKLGDFGCAVKIRANTTAAGELQGYVGTQAYMAPEVFMKSSGHGRAADIWSLGCVVTEMASGRRPFSEYDSNYQIMFVVGMGGRPQVPATLSAEGQQFCQLCLTHEPELRPRADELTTHHFLKVKADDDCKCEASFLKS